MSPGPEYPAGPPLPADFFDQEEEESVSLFGVANLFLRRIRLVIGIPLLVFAIVALTSFLADRPFTATSKLMSAKSDQFSGLSGGGTGLVAQLGQLVGGSEGGSSRFYTALLTSGALTREAARDTYEITVDGETRRGTVAELHGAEPATPELNVRISKDLIGRNMTATSEVGTGFVVLQTKSEWPELAVQVNRRLLELVNEFNVEQRQAQAATEREFIEARMAEAGQDLAQAEGALQRFLETNQQYEQSPRLRFEADRLQRQVAFRQGLYTDLAQSYEQVKIAEVRNTPVTTVVEWPAENIRRERGRSPVFNGFLAAVVALLVVGGFVLGGAFLDRHSEEHSDDYLEFRQLARSLIPPVAARRLGLRDTSAPSPLGNGGRGGRPSTPESDRQDSEPEPDRRELGAVGER